ncbi:hypothetical protein BH10BDE1_BH10BDE1_02060 [soil metagenome]
MIPEKSDPVWKQIIVQAENFEFTALPTKMLFMRIRLIRMQPSEQNLESAIASAYEFFSKNQNEVHDDLEVLFGLKSGLTKGIK